MILLFRGFQVGQLNIAFFSLIVFSFTFTEIADAVGF